VSDVARACRLALESRERGVVNIGSGITRTITSIAEDLARIMGKESIRPHVIGKYRTGDIRHCYADISRAQAVLGFAPEIEFAQGLEELAQWLASQEAEDNIDKATAELEKRGLVA
jgi:dTDP-L-rhamnose 4-epimerase